MLCPTSFRLFVLPVPGQQHCVRITTISSEADVRITSVFLKEFSMAETIKSLMQLVANATDGLEIHGICAPSHFERMEVGYGYFGGLGIRVRGARGCPLARTIAAEIVSISTRFPLGYLETSGSVFDIYCGEIYPDKNSFRELTHKHEAEEEKSDELFHTLNGDGLALEAELKLLLQEQLGEQAEDVFIDLLPEPDGTFCICIRQLPNERRAMDVQSALFRELADHRFIARFPWEDSWNLFCQPVLPQ